MAGAPSLPVLPEAPVAHTYVLTAYKDSDSSAYYEFTDNGVTVAEGDGGWDDATPWAGTYVASAIPNGYHSQPAFRVNKTGTLSGADGSRTGVLVHSDFGQQNSKFSQGCLVLDNSLLNQIKQTMAQNDAEIQAYNQKAIAYNAQVDAYNTATGSQIPHAQTVSLSKGLITVTSPDAGAPTISLSANKSSFDATDFVKLTVSISKPVSKDVWVFVTVNNPDGWQIDSSNVKKDVLVLDSSGKLMPPKPVSQGAGTAHLGSSNADGSTYVALQANISTDGKGAGSKNPGDTSENGFWVRIAAGTTSEEVDVKPDYKVDTGSSRTETFTIADYGVVYANGAYLYKDGTSSNVLLNRQSQGSPVKVTINDQSYTAHLGYSDGKTFAIPQGQQSGIYDDLNKYSPTWDIGVDPDKDHTIVITGVDGSWSTPEDSISIKTKDLNGKTIEITPTYSTSDGVATYTITKDMLKNTEGQLEITGFEDTVPAGAARLEIDPQNQSQDGSGGSQQQAPLQQTIQAPLQQMTTANDAVAPAAASSYTPGGTGTPDSFTSSGAGDTATDANGNVVFQSTINADGTTNVWTYRVVGQPFAATERVYDANGDVTSTTLFDSQGNVLLSGAGTLNADGTTTVVLFNANGQIGGQEIDQKQSYSRVGGPLALTIYQTSGQPYPQSVSNYDDAGDLLSATFYDASGAVLKTETVGGSGYTDQTYYKFFNTSNALIEEIVTWPTKNGYASTDTVYDPTSGNALTVTRYDASGAVYQTGVYSYANGVTTLTLDDASGALSEIDVINADGSETASLFNVTGEPYTSGVTNYNASGYMTSQTLYFSDGHVYQSSSAPLRLDRIMQRPF